MPSSIPYNYPPPVSKMILRYHLPIPPPPVKLCSITPITPPATFIVKRSQVHSRMALIILRASSIWGYATHELSSSYFSYKKWHRLHQSQFVEDFKSVLENYINLKAVVLHWFHELLQLSTSIFTSILYCCRTRRTSAGFLWMYKIKQLGWLAKLCPRPEQSQHWAPTETFTLPFRNKEVSDWTDKSLDGIHTSQ